MILWVLPVTGFNIQYFVEEIQFHQNLIFLGSIWTFFASVSFSLRLLLQFPFIGLTSRLWDRQFSNQHLSCQFSTKDYKGSVHVNAPYLLLFLHPCAKNHVIMRLWCGELTTSIREHFLVFNPKVHEIQS